MFSRQSLKVITFMKEKETIYFNPTMVTWKYTDKHLQKCLRNREENNSTFFKQNFLVFNSCFFMGFFFFF